MAGGEGRGDVKVWKGGQAGDTLRFLSSMPTHQEPLATPIMAVGHAPPASPRLGAPWSPRPARSGALGWGAGRERARGPGGQRGPGGRRDCGEGPGPPPSALPAHQELQTRRQKPAALPARPTCSARGSYLWSPRGTRGGRPLRGQRSFLLLRKPPAQLPASRTGGAGTPGQGARLAAGDM